MSEVKVNKISPRTNCGTVQLGDSGDTITIPAGATITNNGTQTGFGRTGTVDWDTTAKTASFTAVSGNGYFVNTTSAAITLTLPATPSAGDIVAFKDYAFTFATNNLTVDGNGSPIGGVDGTQNPTYSTNGTSKTFIYVDGTKGWLVTNESTDTSQEANPTYIVATGGTITCCGDYKIHTFTSPGTFTVCSVGNPAGSDSIDYLVVAGGGGGGQSPGSVDSAGGGGAGGYRESSGAASGCYSVSPLGACVSALPVTAQGYPITIGGGGAGGGGAGTNGSNSIFSSITSAGGGGGGTYPSCIPGKNGGSGGGGSGGNPDNAGASPGGTGNTPPVSPPQGQNGANGSATGDGGANNWFGGGGGGATQAGTVGSSPSVKADGGDGGQTSISASATYYAGGGGGGAVPGRGIPVGGAGGLGGGASAAGCGTANTGGGGGGGTNSCGGYGGSGIVIIRYKYQ